MAGLARKLGWQEKASAAFRYVLRPGWQSGRVEQKMVIVGGFRNKPELGSISASLVV